MIGVNINGLVYALKFVPSHIGQGNRMPIGWMGLDKHVDAENIAQNIGLHNGLRGCIRNQMAIFQGNDLIGKARSQIDIVQNGDDAQ
ncbi:MAG: hypothetical protein GYB47_20225, partial [Rhodospirillales bacterium]|nr:hypothetical protein [Rhodospirillales bacterium]